MRISQELLRDITSSWGDINLGEDPLENHFSKMGNLDMRDLEKVFLIADEAKNNCDYETANTAFAALLEVLFQTRSEIVVEYEHDNDAEDNYMHLVWLSMGSYRLNIPAPILKEGALEMALRFEKKRFIRIDHNRVCSIFNHETLLQHRQMLTGIFGEELLLHACCSNLIDNYQPDWL